MTEKNVGYFMDRLYELESMYEQIEGPVEASIDGIEYLEEVNEFWNELRMKYPNSGQIMTQVSEEFDFEEARELLRENTD